MVDDDVLEFETYAPFKYDLFSNADVQIHFDWFSFTFPLIDDEVDVQVYLRSVIMKICEMLGFDYDTEITFFNYAANYYQQTYQMGVHSCFRAFSNKTMCNYNDRLYHSCQFEITGSGCREIESRLKVDYLKLWNYILVDLHGKCKRVDICIDDIKGDQIKLKEIKELVENDFFTSKYFRTNIKPPLPTGTLKNGYSLTFGTRDGNQLCIYDKNSELAQKYGYEKYDEYYVRYEMRFRDKRANDLIGTSSLMPHFLANNDDNAVGKFCMQQLYSMLDLKEKNDYSERNQYKVDTYPGWLSFLKIVENSKFSLSKGRVSSISSKQKWYLKNMTGLMLSFGFSKSFDNKDDYINPFIPMFIAFLESMLEKLNDTKYMNKNLPVIKDYLITVHNLPNNYNLIEDIHLLEKTIKDVINELKKAFELPF